MNDLNLALRGAKALGAALPGTSNAAQLMQACVVQGWGEMDPTRRWCERWR